jgi:hypothetical protein
VTSNGHRSKVSGLILVRDHRWRAAPAGPRNHLVTAIRRTPVGGPRPAGVGLSLHFLSPLALERANRMQLRRVFISSVFGGFLDLRAVAASAAHLAGLYPVLTEQRVAGLRVGTRGPRAQ